MFLYCVACWMALGAGVSLALELGDVQSLLGPRPRSPSKLPEPAVQAAVTQLVRVHVCRHPVAVAHAEIAERSTWMLFMISSQHRLQTDQQ